MSPRLFKASIRLMKSSIAVMFMFPFHVSAQIGSGDMCDQTVSPYWQGAINAERAFLQSQFEDVRAQQAQAQQNCPTQEPARQQCIDDLAEIAQNTIDFLTNQYLTEILPPLEQMWQEEYDACVAENSDESPEPPDSPLVIDLDNNGFEFTDRYLDPVSFDIDADGEIELTSWTSSDGRDAFLAMDRNNNRRIDDGSELFGNATPLTNGDLAINGFEALAEFDNGINGGNEDGLISQGDRVFRDLLIWIDSNHNGVSERRELRSARGAGVKAIDLNYYLHYEVDEFGNLLLFHSEALIRSRGSELLVPVVDVYFTTQ